MDRSLRSRQARQQLDPNNAQNLKISSLSLDVNAADGSEIRIEAVEGELDNDAKVAYLSGLARLETSTGYTMETNGLTANLQSGVISSDGALEIRAPFGALTAGRVTIETTGDGKGQQMLFTDGVVLIYTPQAASCTGCKRMNKTITLILAASPWHRSKRPKQISTLVALAPIQKHAVEVSADNLSVDQDSGTAVF